MKNYLKLREEFNDIYFDEEPHKYTDSVGTEYTSVTTFIQKYFVPEVDSKLLAEKCSSNPKKKEYFGKTVKSILKEWDYKKDYSCKLGTEIHAVMEYLWNGKKYYPKKDIIKNYKEMSEDYDFREIEAKDIFNELKKTYVPILNEFIVYDRDWKICGTIDFLCYNKKTKKYAILDWKTSKEFKKDNRFGKLNAPFNNLDSCNCNEYSLQLSTYKAIVEKHCPDIKIEELTLVQIPAKGTTPEIYNCKDLSNEITNYMNIMNGLKK